MALLGARNEAGLMVSRHWSAKNNVDSLFQWKLYAQKVFGPILMGTK